MCRACAATWPGVSCLLVPVQIPEIVWCLQNVQASEVHHKELWSRGGGLITEKTWKILPLSSSLCHWCRLCSYSLVQTDVSAWLSYSFLFYLNLCLTCLTVLLCQQSHSISHSCFHCSSLSLSHTWRHTKWFTRTSPALGFLNLCWRRWLWDSHRSLCPFIICSGTIT